MTPGATDHILIQVDIQMLFPGIVITAGAADVVDWSSIWGTGDADQRDNIGYMNFDHAASFPGDAMCIPLIDKQLMQLPAP